MAGLGPATLAAQNRGSFSRLAIRFRLFPSLRVLGEYRMPSLDCGKRGTRSGQEVLELGIALQELSRVTKRNVLGRNGSYWPVTRSRSIFFGCGRMSGPT